MLSFFQKSLVGLDIGTHSIKLVELDVAKDSYRLKNFGMAKLPKETIVNGVIINAEPVIQSIKNLIANLKITNKNAAVSISGHPVIIKKITIPQMDGTELEQSIETESEQYIPYDIDEVNLDYQMLDVNPEESDKMDVMLVAAKKANIEEYMGLIKSTGLNAKIVDIDVFALENMFYLNYEDEIEEEEIDALIDIGASLSNINILKNDLSIFNRDVPLAGNQITEDIQKELSVSFEEAETLKTGEEIEGISQDQIDEIINKASLTVVREIQRTLDFFVGGNYGEINKIFLSGGGAKTRGLKDLLAEKMDIPVEFTDPFKRIKYDKKTFDPEYIRDISLITSVGVGLAWRQIGDKDEE